MLFSACFYLLLAVLTYSYFRLRSRLPARHLYSKLDMLSSMPRSLSPPASWSPLPLPPPPAQSKDLTLRVKSLSKGYVLRLPSTDESDFDRSCDSSWSGGRRDSPCCDKDVREENRRLVTLVLAAEEYSQGIKEAFEKVKEGNVGIELRTYEVLLRAAIEGSDLPFTNQLLTEISAHGYSLRSSLIEAYLSLFNRVKRGKPAFNPAAEEFKPREVEMSALADEFVPAY